MTTVIPLQNPDRFYIGGKWVPPATDATVTVVDPSTEEPFFRVAEATAADMDKAVSQPEQPSIADHGRTYRTAKGLATSQRWRAACATA